MPSTPVPIVLQGRHVRVEPLTLGHVPGLFAAGGRDEEVWRWLSAPTPASEEDLLRIVAERLRDVEEGRRVAFAVLGRSHGTVIGATNLHSWQQADGCVEMGGTWFGRPWWRTAANTETKLLVLSHAFETLGFDTVAWRIDVDNIRSQEAITRVGARLKERREGALPKPDGSRRDLLVYSMSRAEWTSARARLIDRLARAPHESRHRATSETGPG